MACIDYDGLWGNLTGADQEPDAWDDPIGEGW